MKLISLTNAAIKLSFFFASASVSAGLALKRPKLIRYAKAGTKVVQKATEPNTLAKPNSVIWTPCLWNDSMVTASSGTAIPNAINMPAMVADNLYLTVMFSREGIRNFSLMIPYAMSK